MEPPWLQIARGYIGLKEIPGKDTAPVIAGWLRRLKAQWSDDATPWCGTFVATCFTECGFPIVKHWYRARAWLDWGVPLLLPAVGAVAVYVREGGGHVGFLVGQDRAGRLMTLGGNQGDKVSIASFNRERVLGFRWPASVTLPVPGLPMINSSGEVSSNES